MADQKDALEVDREEALRQLMLARNASAMRRLANDQGMTAEELVAFARDELGRQTQHGGEDRLGPRYDISTGKYSTLEEWVARFFGGR